MVGYLRFLLATLVVLSHLNVRCFGYNPGVFAVIIFYILAGWGLSRLWHDILDAGPRRMGRLVIDRALRIYPLYGYVMLLTLVFLVCTGYGNPEFNALPMLGNALIIPLNYFMWLSTEILTEPPWCLIPPAWSLGAELQAYLALMLIFPRPTMKAVLGVLSFGIYVVAAMGLINTDYYGYRLLPGILYIFLLGHCLQRRHAGQANLFETIFPLLIWALSVILMVKFISTVNSCIPYNVETAAGILIGIPVVKLIHQFRGSLPGNSMLGSLSYGLFLSHFLVIWILKSGGIDIQPVEKSFVLKAVVVMAGSGLIAWLGVRYLEEPIRRRRIKTF
jgi:peptidoglycan/LPS O-acetylase OafA/YrhL